MNEKDTFLKTSFPREPKAGAVLYWVPVYAYTTVHRALANLSKSDRSCHTCSDEGKDDNLGNRDEPEGFPEIIGILHLGDEARKRNLPNKGVADVEHRVHACDESGARRGNDEDDWLASHFDSVGIDVVRVRIVPGGMIFDSSEDSSQQNADEGEDCTRRGKFGECVKGPGQRADPRNHRTHEAQGHRADCVGAHHRVDVARDDQHMETLDEGVVEDEHDCCRPPCPSGVPEQYLSNIRDIANLWMP